jgi:PEP-CTERM motif
MNKSIHTATLFVAAVTSLHAAAVGSLTWVTPNGTVGPTDSIPIEVMLSLSPGSVALTTDAMGHVTSGYSLSDVHPNPNAPPGVNVATDTLFGVMTVGIGCPGFGPNIDTFVGAGGCVNGSPYNFQFANGPGTIFVPNLDLEPGMSSDFAYGMFAPAGGGPVAPGTYDFNVASYAIAILDATVLTNGAPSNIATIPIALTLNSNAGNFERTVQAAPEPGTYLLLGGGIALLSVFRRRRAQ